MGATDSHFTDTNKVWNFEDQNVSATFHRLAFVGGTGTNKATFGVLAGSGVAEEGSGGNTFNAAGIRPFRVKAEDERIGVGLYGCTLTNPTGLRSDAPRAVLVEDNSGSSFADDTYDAIDAGANDVFAFATATPNTNDSLNIGHNDTFSQISVNVGTAGVGAYTTTWEYMVDDTPTWAGLSGVIDDTASFQTAGTNTVSWTNPYDWGSGALGGRGSHYWIRARKDAGSETTRANISQITADMGGSIVWAHTGAKMIRCTLSNMDTITVRSGAFIKKCTITDSVATSGNGALDLGTGNPATNSVRDLTIQNCNKGILLKGTSTGSTSYDFQNIQFANNTNDVRVDFPAAGTVVINVLEGGSTPTVDNVNGSTVTINNSVTLTVTVKDAAGAAIENAQTAIYLDSDSSELLNADTNASGVASVSFAYTTDVAVTVRVRKSSTGATKYFSVASPQTIGSDGLNVTITLLEDIIVT